MIFKDCDIVIGVYFWYIKSRTNVIREYIIGVINL